MKITVLTDNNGHEELEGEWGLSFLIEYEDRNILLDAGATDLFLKNASLMGIDLSDIDFAVLSHAHYDHGNGFVPLFEQNNQVRLYLQKCCGASCYAEKERQDVTQIEYIGLPEELFDTYSSRLVRVEGDYRLADDIYLIPHKKPGRDVIGRREKMYVKTADGMIPDDFSHEQSLVFDTAKGLVIFNSCSHAGASDIIDEVCETFSGKPVIALLGGFHLYNKTEDEVRKFAKRLKDTHARHVFTGHCTGEDAFRILKEELGDSISQFYAGLEIMM